MITVYIRFTNIWEADQKKSFESIEKAVEFCRRNSSKIHVINGYMTYGEPVNHFDLMNYIKDEEGRYN